MRGKEAEGDALLNAYGITPAYAGKRILRRLRQISPLDHPRVCGEKAQWKEKSNPRTGSPPRMRGKALSGLLITGQGRITPAYAGKRAPFCGP